MKTITLIFISVAILSGCKATKDLSEKKEDIGGLEQPKERNYTVAELAIGRRICAALKHKRELFEKIINMQEKFRFKGETKACDNSTPYNISEFSVAISNASSSNFEYISTSKRANYFKDVVTDQDGAMKILCENLSVSENVSNTMLSGNSSLSVNLLISEDYDRFDVLKSSKDSNGKYKLMSSETVTVITQKSQADEKFFGVEKERVRNTTCPDSSDYASLKQTWVAALTSF